MPILNGFSEKTVLLSVVMLIGLPGVAQLARAQEPSSNSQYLQGTPRCVGKQNQHQHPSLCAGLADLYRARHELAKGDEARQDHLDHNPHDAANDKAAYEDRQKAIHSIDIAIKDARAAILTDHK